MANPPLENVSASPVECSTVAHHLAADAQSPACDTKVPPGRYNTVNLERQNTDEGTITRYPNGVTILTGQGVEGMTAPPGGKVDGDGKGGSVIYDSNHKVVANVDADRTVHVHTKNGEYTETSDGKVSFKPTGSSDLRTLHKPGHVPHSKYEDYGVSTDGKTTRFPNGIDYDPKTGNTTIPPEYPNFNEAETTDKDGNIVAKTGYDGDGHKLYTIDGNGIHVPTSDGGTLSQNGNGQVSFKQAETPATKTLPRVDISDPLNPNNPCWTGSDPLCGLDLGKF